MTCFINIKENLKKILATVASMLSFAVGAMETDGEYDMSSTRTYIRHSRIRRNGTEKTGTFSCGPLWRSGYYSR
jgi:hypothetical protein